jgi:hypothetical protein
MVDYFVALLVLVAVIVFGALITVGNERQKRELAHIREVEEQWAEQDLRIKRGKLSREISIEDPAAWLSAAMTRAMEVPVALVGKEVFENPDSVRFTDSESGQMYIFTLLPPAHIKKISKERKSNRLGALHPLIPVKRGAESTELNMLNGGLLFDLELPHTWKGLTGKDTRAERIWMYKM